MAEGVDEDALGLRLEGSICGIRIVATRRNVATRTPKSTLHLRDERIAWHLGMHAACLPPSLDAHVADECFTSSCELATRTAFVEIKGLYTSALDPEEQSILLFLLCTRSHGGL
mmetsp:Transcript_54629/g.90436  ORF Transcript_54629/g.90436 Transcript_54629/m.90436 type:complete len:114 (+) Transcript_54629:204-545(+)